MITITEEHRHQLKDAVTQRLIDFKNKENLEEINFALMGFSRMGKQSLSASESTWQYSYQSIPGGLEYLARYNAVFKEDYRVINPLSLGLQRQKMQIGEMSLASGNTKNLPEFVKSLPQWPELGYKPRWGKWNRNQELSNTWNVAVLCILFEVVYGELPHYMGLVNQLKATSFTPTCQFNLCLGKPGANHPLLTQETREEMIKDLVSGKKASPLETKSLDERTPSNDFQITFS